MIRRSIAWAVLMVPMTSVDAASFQVLTGLSDVADAGFGFGSSGNELVIVGSANPPGDGPPSNGYRWTASTGIQYTGTLRDGSYSRGLGVSNNGAVVVGEDCCGSEGFKWSPGAGITRFGALGGETGESVAYDVSADGSTIVGLSGRPPGDGGGYIAVRWTATDGMVPLGHLPGLDYMSAAQGVSADGSTIVGVSTAGPSDGQAFRWTQAAGMIGLGDLPGGVVSSNGWAVSGDGSVVVGESYSANGIEAFRWTSAGGMVGLGFLPSSTESYAHAISADGSLIGGRSPFLATTNGAFLWTQAGGMRRLSDVLNGLGVQATGWNLYDIKAISPDGQWIVGVALNGAGNSRPFVANIAAVPLPAGLWLLGSALGVLGVMRRKLIS